MISAQPVATLTPTSLTFPGLRVTTGATAMQMIVVTNTGDTGNDLSITAASISGGAAGDYTIISQPSLPAIIAPGTGSAIFMIQFDPSTAGARNASLDLTTSDPFA